MNVLRVSHYRVLEHLGSGGSGDVYIAEDVRLKRKVALKLIHETTLEARQQLFQEAHFASMINHPNVVAIYDLGEDDMVSFVATEYVEGETLRVKLEHGPLPVLEAIDVAVSIGFALDAAHHVWIVHRDIKPENIMIRPDHFVKVLDFGVAKLVAGAVPVDPIRQRVAIVGTLAYLSPEQVRGDLVDNRSDLYSLGVVLYEMLTGRLPFPNDDVLELLAAIVEREPPALGDHLPAALDCVLKRALDKNVFTRYQTASELIADLQSVRAQLVPQG